MLESVDDKRDKGCKKDMKQFDKIKSVDLNNLIKCEWKPSLLLIHNSGSPFDLFSGGLFFIIDVSWPVSQNERDKHLIWKSSKHVLLSIY